MQDVSRYYTEKVQTFGATPRGVDWNGEESQEMRFTQLTKNLLQEKETVSVLDFGCGYGSLATFLENSGIQFQYTGFDISPAMLEKGAQLHQQKPYSWISQLPAEGKFDYVILSGIFNVKLEKTEEEWKQYIQKSLGEINEITTKEFAFNILTSYSDKEYMRDYLYYANPEYWFSYCMNTFSRKVILNHSYPLYEFTMHVVKK